MHREFGVQGHAANHTGAALKSGRDDDAQMATIIIVFDRAYFDAHMLYVPVPTYLRTFWRERDKNAVRREIDDRRILTQRVKICRIRKSKSGMVVPGRGWTGGV